MQNKLLHFFTIVLVLVLVVAGAVLAVGFFSGAVLTNNPSLEDYPVKGVDVSAYQGQIDWATLSAQDNISFAFIKATEGSSFVDGQFKYNYTEARKTKLRVGAYHFFSFESSGKAQAEHFIKTVEKTDNMLPPVIDLEFYGKFWKTPLDAAAVQRELSIMLTLLEEHYEIRPIIYLTDETYFFYVQDHYKNYDIWYRNVYTSTGLSDKREWKFWQYTNRNKLNGYSGEEEFIDMNVFNGTAEQFAEYGIKAK